MARLTQEKAKAKRVGMMRKWNETRLPKLENCELKLQNVGESS